MLARYFRYQDGVLPNLAALSLTLLGYPLGIAFLTHPSWLVKAAGFFLVTLTLVWSAYFIHEFAHHAIFKSGPVNMRWGTAMSWINGSCYARFDNLRRKHMRHHVERADVITFDVKAFLLAAPAWLRTTVLALEWLYFPAVEFLMRGFVMAMPFRKGQPMGPRLRVLAIFAVRTAAFVALGWYAPSALVLYCVAYLLFVTILRFADCFQHTYDAYPIMGDAPVPNDKVRDKVYEQANTYSDIVGLDNRVLNMLWLNFGFHNAHHEKPAMPWHKLPALHRDLYADKCVQVIPVRTLIKSFHIHRVNRILADDYGRVLPHGAPGRADGFLGAAGVSFLTAV
jgi:fatty acid desaturase